MASRPDTDNVKKEVKLIGVDNTSEKVTDGEDKVLQLQLCFVPLPKESSVPLLPDCHELV